MKTTVKIEHPTKYDPKSAAVVKGEPFIIARVYDNHKTAIQSEPDIFKAMRSRNILAEHSVKNGGQDNYRIFKADQIVWEK